MRLIKRASLLGCLSAIVSGCSIFSPVATAPKEVYLINTVPAHVATRHRRNITVTVNVPEALPIYATSDIAYTTNAYQMSYFSKADWAASPAQMLEPLIVHTLQNTHHFHAVSQAPAIGTYDYTITSQLYELVQDFRYKPSLLRMKLRAQIIKTSTGRIVATKEFMSIVPTVVDTPYGGVIAANLAAEHILQELAAFCVRKI